MIGHAARMGLLAALGAQSPAPDDLLEPGLPMEPEPLSASGPDVIAPRPNTPTVLFINFDGAVLRRGCGNDAHFDCSTLSSRFDGFIPPFTGGATPRSGIVQGARRDLEPFGVRVVSERPPDDIPYSQVIYGALGAQDFAGIAPYIDCGDQFPSDTSFSQPYFNANLGATVVVHEAGHTWGLEHIESLDDNMFPVAEATSATFTDVCHQIVANTDLDPGGGICNAMHTKWCPVGQENTFQELRFLFGDPLEDTEAPSVEIITPADGSIHELPVVLNLGAELRDDVNPQLYDVQLFVDGELAFDQRLWGEVDFPFIPPEPGVYEVRIVVSDPSGKMGEDAVSFEVVPEDTIEVPPAPHGCAVVEHDDRPGPVGAALGLVGLWGLRIRRRRFAARDAHSAA